MRCLGHILNLTVQDFLCVQDINQTEDDSISIEDINTNQRFGALGKLHNLAIALARDPQKLQRFKTISNGLILLRDNSTRWNSWHKLIQRAIKLRSQIDRYYNLWDKDNPDYLTQDDWVVVEQVSIFPFKTILIKLTIYSIILYLQILIIP